MPPDLAKRLAARGLTADDYKTILSADPFATGSTTIDSNRFIQTSTTFPYEPPLSANDGPTLQTYTLTNESADTNTKTNTSSTTVDLKIVVSASAAGIVKV